MGPRCHYLKRLDLIFFCSAHQVQELTENRDSLTAKLKSLSKTTSQLTTSLTAREKEVNELKMRLEEERNRDGEAVETANKKVKSIEERASQLENALRKEILRQQNKVASANSALATADAKFDSVSNIKHLPHI